MFLMRKLFVAAAVCCGFVATDRTASALVVQVTVTGQVTYGTDPGHLFKVSGGSLAGLDYTAVFKFDTDLGISQFGVNSEGRYGGSYYKQLGPSLGATLTINGQSQSIAGSYSSEISAYWGGYDRADFRAEDQSGYLYRSLSISNTKYSDVLPHTISTAYSHLIASDGIGTWFAFINALGVLEAFGALSIASTTLAPLETPLPAALPLFATVMAGGGLIALRRKRKQAKVEA
jgi:hypothetical protein